MTDNLVLSLQIRADSKSFREDVSQARVAIDKFEREVRGSGRAATEAAGRQERLARSTDRLKHSTAGATRAFSLLQRVGIGFGAAQVARSVLGTAASFEQLRLRLKVFEGDAQAATRRFAELQEYAARTPFALRGVVEAYLRLAATNFDPDLEALRSLGDIAAASGRSIEELADAIAAVGRGENDPIEGFGFEVRKQGEQVRIAFRDTVRVVENSRTAILRAFAEIGDSKFGGATQELSRSLTGAFSNLGDALDRLQDKVAQGGLGTAITSLATRMSEVGGAAEGLALATGAVTGAVVNLLGTLAPLGVVYAAHRIGMYANAAAARAMAGASNLASASFLVTARRLGAMARTGQAARVAMLVLNRALGLLGGPIGLITTALTLGAVAWATWGNSAERATEQAARSLRERVDAILASQRSPLDEITRARREQEAHIGELNSEMAEVKRTLATPLGTVYDNLFGHPFVPHEVREARRRSPELQKEIDEETLRLAGLRAAEARLRREAKDTASATDPNLTAIAAIERAELDLAPSYERSRARAERWREETLAGLDKTQAGYKKHAAQVEHIYHRLLTRAAIEEEEALRRFSGPHHNTIAAIGRATLELMPSHERARVEAGRWREETLASLDKTQEGYAEAAAQVEAIYHERIARAAAEAAEAQLRASQPHRDAIAEIGRAALELMGPYDRALAEAERWREETLASLDKTQEGYEEYAAQVEDVYRDRIARAATEAAEAQLRSSRRWRDGATRALDDYASVATDAARNAQEALSRGFQQAEEALVASLRRGKLSFGDFADFVISELTRIAVRQQILGPIAAAVQGLFGGGSGAGAGLEADLGIAHGGAVVGSLGGVRRSAVDGAVFARAPRYHAGGIVGGEVPIIARRGEGVFTPEQMRALAPAGGSNIHIEFVNRGTPQREVTREVRQEPERVVVGIVLEDLASNGPIARASRALGRVS